MKQCLFIVLIVYAATVSSGCKTLSQEGSNVTVTKSMDDVRDCTAIGEVTASPPFVGPKDAEYTMRNKVAMLKGDVLLILKMSVGTAEGMAYKCGS